MTPHQALSVSDVNRRALLARHRAVMAQHRVPSWRTAANALPLDPGAQARGFADAIAGRPRDPAGTDPLSYFAGFTAGLLARRR